VDGDAKEAAFEAGVPFLEFSSSSPIPSCYAGYRYPIFSKLVDNGGELADYVKSCSLRNLQEILSETGA